MLSFWHEPLPQLLRNLWANQHDLISNFGESLDTNI